MPPFVQQALWAFDDVLETSITLGLRAPAKRFRYKSGVDPIWIPLGFLPYVLRDS
jgi:hypothetical protein